MLLLLVSPAFDFSKLEYHSGKGTQVKGHQSHNYHHAILSTCSHLEKNKLISSSVTGKVTNVFISILSLELEPASLASRSWVGQQQDPRSPEPHCSYPHWTLGSAHGSGTASRPQWHARLSCRQAWREWQHPVGAGSSPWSGWGTSLRFGSTASSVPWNTA